MNKQNRLLFTVTLAIIGATAAFLYQAPKHQRLGQPGVRTRPLAGSNRLQVVLPEQVLDYDSQWLDEDEITLNTLPKDTSFGERLYRAKSPEGFQLVMNVVLMGTDRSSLHKPQFCLTGQGWSIDSSASTETVIPISRPGNYDLPVVKLVASKDTVVDGQHQLVRGVYVYWFVAEDALSASVRGYQRMWMMSKKLLTTGVLQRWAYVSCFSVCPPGDEDATFERMKKFIAASVPEFQLTPRPPLATASTGP